MFILDEPYVSPQLRRAATDLGAPVLDNRCARRELDGVGLVADDAFAEHYLRSDRPRLYTNSENSLGWIREHLSGTDLPAQVEALKDKVRFRELLADLDPDYRFEQVRLEALDSVDPTWFGGPFVAKPAVGFFSLGVQIVEDPRDWPAAAGRLRDAGERFRGLYPDAVLELDRFVLEQVIEGDEFAVDAYYDRDGAVTIVNVLEHPFAHGADVSDRVYRVRPAVIERTHDLFVEHLGELGRRAGLRDVPIHVEFRIAADGTVRPIEANPMRFGGWCATDIATHGWGLCPYTTFLRDERPDWTRLCEEGQGWTTALVVADLPADLDRTRVTSIDYEAFAARFSRPLELRRVEDPRHPVFAFLFVRVRDDELDQLDAVLHADLTEYVRLG
ncbi:MAG TPA: ATP-grasp domain-containing protein [Candidatus Krumholzibacteria bacterium]|nr:ATP-grasp domain-containing protein [Candidatus Krumholzibacteria bacterium]